MKDSFARYWILGWQGNISFITLNISTHCFWLPRFLRERNLITVFWKPLVCVVSFLLLLKSGLLIICAVSWCASLWIHPIRSFLSFLNVYIHVFHQIWQDFRHYFFRNLQSLSHLPVGLPRVYKCSTGPLHSIQFSSFSFCSSESMFHLDCPQFPWLFLLLLESSFKFFQWIFHFNYCNFQR